MATHGKTKRAKARQCTTTQGRAQEGRTKHGTTKQAKRKDIQRGHAQTRKRQLHTSGSITTHHIQFKSTMPIRAAHSDYRRRPCSNISSRPERDSASQTDGQEQSHVGSSNVCKVCPPQLVTKRWARQSPQPRFPCPSVLPSVSFCLGVPFSVCIAETRFIVFVNVLRVLSTCCPEVFNRK